MSDLVRRISSLTISVIATMSLAAGFALAQNGALTITKSGAAQSEKETQAPLDGYGVVSPTSVDFGQVLVGQTSPQKRVRLTNTGDTDITVASISISGHYALPVNHCGNGVKPGTHCDVYVTFSPVALETETGTLTFSDDASNNPQTVSLTGVGSNTAPTVTKLTASPTGTYAGQPITFTAVVNSLGGGVIPDGEQVTFSWYGTLLGYGALNSGVANLTTSAIYYKGQATQKIVAQYLGDRSFQPSGNFVDVSIGRYTPTVTVTSSPNPSLFGEPVTLTGNVTSDSGYPVGGESYLGGLCGYQGARVHNGVATHVCKDVHRTDAGNYQIGMNYRGDGYDDPGDGVSVHVINPTTTSTSITSSKNPSAQGQAVKFGVVVKAPYGLPVEGSVIFTSGSDTLGTVQLSDGRASVTTTSLPVGQNTITATYDPPNGNYVGSAASLVQTVQ